MAYSRTFNKINKFSTKRYRRVKSRWTGTGKRITNFNKWKRSHPDGRQALRKIKRTVRKNKSTIKKYLGGYLQSKIQYRHPYPRSTKGGTMRGGTLIID